MTEARKKLHFSNSVPAAGALLVIVMAALAAAAAGPQRLPDAPPLPILAWGGPPQEQSTRRDTGHTEWTEQKALLYVLSSLCAL